MIATVTRCPTGKAGPLTSEPYDPGRLAHTVAKAYFDIYGPDTPAHSTDGHTYVYKAVG